MNKSEAYCSVCEWPDPIPKADSKEKVVYSISRQLARYQRYGIISQKTYLELTASLGIVPEASDVKTPTPIVPPLPTEVPHPVRTPSPPPRQPAHSVEPRPKSVQEEPTAPTPTENIPPAIPPIISKGLPPSSPEKQAGAKPKKPATVEEQVSAAESRVRKYTKSRTTAIAEAIAAPPQSPPKPPRREAFGKLFAAFLEEKNIRWGELVGGLLIVCCSTALVISFWSEISARPLLKFCLFNGVSAAMFGIGFYTHHRWKIHTTSNGILITSILLVPLNFLAIAAFTDKSPPSDFLALGGEVLSLMLFTAFTFFGARIITPKFPAFTTIGVMVPSLMQLLVRRFIGENSSLGTVYSLAAIPLASYLLSLGFAIARNMRRASLRERAANRLFILLGIVSYAVLFPLALLLLKTENFLSTLRHLSPLVVLLGLPSLATGLLFLKRFVAKKHAGMQTVGIGVGVLGAIIMLGAIALAWPQPALLIPTACVNAFVFALVAWQFKLPQANLVTGLCVMIAWLVGFHLMRGNVSWNLTGEESLANAILSAASGNALVPLAAFFFGIAAVWKRAANSENALWWAISAAMMAISSLALAVIYGFARSGDPQGVVWTFALYTILAVLATFQIKHRLVAWVASGLLLLTLVQGIVFRFAETRSLEHPWVLAFLIHATVVIAGYFVVWKWNKSNLDRLKPIFISSSFGTSTVALVALFAKVYVLSWNVLAIYLLWIAFVWLAIAIASQQRVVFTAFQVALSAALVCGVTASVSTRTWYLEANRPWLDPWFLQTVGVALALYCVVWQGLRIFSKRWSKRPTQGNNVQVGNELANTAPVPLTPGGVALLNPPYLSIDRLFQIALFCLLLALAIYAVVPGIAQELAPLDKPGLATRVVPPSSSFTLSDVPVEHAQGKGAWLFLGAVVLFLMVGLWERWALLSGLGLILALATSCPLIATWWSAEVSVASAFRWLLSGFVAIASIPVWFRKPIAPRIQKMGIDIQTRTRLLPDSPAVYARGLLVGLFACSHAAMILYAASSAVTKSSVPDNLFPLIQGLSVLCVIALVVVLLLSKTTFSKQSKVSLSKEGQATWKTFTRILALLLGVGPLLVLWVFIVANALKEHPFCGPEPDAWFRTIGWSICYGLPLALFACTLIGYAIRERSSGYAFAAGLLLNLVATAVYLLEISKAGRALDGVTWIEVAQVNSIVSALFAMFWTAAHTWHEKRLQQTQLQKTTKNDWPLLTVSQVLIASTICGLPLAAGGTSLVMHPVPASWAAAVGGPLGWVAFVLSLTTAAALLWRSHLTITIHHIGWMLVAASSMIALTAARFDTGNWLGYHTLLVCMGATAWLLAFLPRLVVADKATIDHEQTNSTGWPAILMGLTIALGVRAILHDPAAPWWTLTAWIAMAALSLWLGWLSKRRSYIWIAGILANMSVSLWWIESGSTMTLARGFSRFSELVLINIITAASMSLLSVLFERKRISTKSLSQNSKARNQRPEMVAEQKGFGTGSNKTLGEEAAENIVPKQSHGLIGFHRVATWVCILTLGIATGFALLSDFHGSFINFNIVLYLGAFVATILAAIACFWDVKTRFPVASFYCAGLVAVGIFLDFLNVQGHLFVWCATLLLASFALVTSYLWSQREKLRLTAVRFGGLLSLEQRNQTPSRDGHAWLVAANYILSVVLVALVFWIEFSYPEYAQRIVAAYALLAAALSLALLAIGKVRSTLQYSSLLLGVLFAIAFGWAWLPVTIANPILHRTIAAAVAIAVAIPFYGFGIVKLWQKENEWTKAASKLTPILVGTATVLLIFVLGIEIVSYLNEGSVEIALPALIAVAGAILGLTLAALSAALLPGRDPLGMSERGRTLYVYGAEALLGLLFMHIRITMPWLFTGWFLRFWPLVVMGIAFLGVGIAEWANRRKQRVVSEPLGNTGALLPMLPVLGYWMLPSEINYSFLLLAVGALYTVLSVLRKSFLFGILAILAANGSLWYLLQSSDSLGLLQHPQLWLIPPALCVLIAAYLNRSRLSSEQMTSIRYLSSIAIYASSTAEVFINGVGEAPWLPIVLAAISILGIFAGIMLRVRAFLYLGFSFLLIALLTIIWHAAVELQMTWIWWVCGIVTGIFIIGMFGLFEKKRDEMLKIVEIVKQWEK